MNKVIVLNWNCEITILEGPKIYFNNYYVGQILKMLHHNMQRYKIIREKLLKILGKIMKILHATVV